jgi:hypothetical protein
VGVAGQTRVSIAWPWSVTVIPADGTAPMLTGTGVGVGVGLGGGVGVGVGVGLGTGVGEDAAWTVEVAVEDAELEPTALVAVTTTTIVCPTSE